MLSRHTCIHTSREKERKREREEERKREREKERKREREREKYTHAYAQSPLVPQVLAEFSLLRLSLLCPYNKTKKGQRSHASVLDMEKRTTEKRTSVSRRNSCPGVSPYTRRARAA